MLGQRLSCTIVFGYLKNLADEFINQQRKTNKQSESATQLP